MRLSNLARFTGPTLLLAALPACSRTKPPPPLPPPSEVTVSLPTQREIVDYHDFTGRTAAIESVTIRARVTGYLAQVHFKEGGDVQAGDLLYEIDPRAYQTALDQARGNLAAAEARLQRLDTDLSRARKLLESKVISQEDFDRTASDRSETAANIQALHAALERAELDLGFTRISAPIAGWISRTEITAGNLVMADSTALTTIVRSDPMQAYFDVDERSALLYRGLIRAKKVQSAREAHVPAYLGLADEEGFPHEGTIDFVDNQLDPASGTIRLRAVFDNAERILSPGLFVRVRVPFSQPHAALLVDEQALASDQRGQYVLTVDAEDVVQYRPVETGTTVDGQVVIERGLTAEERVVVNGLQRARPGGKVSPSVAAAPVAPARAAGQR